MLINILIGLTGFGVGYLVGKIINDDDPWNDGFGW